MKVLKLGLIHEYTNYEASVHCEAHIRCLEALDRIAGTAVRAKADLLVRKNGSIRSQAYELQRECSDRLNKLAPADAYFGSPSVNSNMAGFWPRSWIAGATERNPKGVQDIIARQLGEAVLG